MKKILNGYVITYIINIVLTIMCMVLLVYYYHSLSIGTGPSGQLVGIFQFDLAQFWLIIFLLILLFASLIALIIYLLITIKQSRKQQLEKSAKLGVIIVPIAFFMLLHVVAGISVTITPSEPFDNEWLCSDERFEEWKNFDPLNSHFEYYSQENIFGKVIDLDHAVFLANENNELMGIKYQCSYRKSSFPSIFSKFSKRRPYTNEDFYEKAESNEKYTVYYCSEDNFHSYYFVMENDNSYLFACYTVCNTNDLSNYSIDAFVEDILTNYDVWNK